MNSVVPLPITADAQLPQRYEAARTAIAECERIDECKTWSDKAAALASYARQAKDDSLRVMAIRIQARAERRCGELLKQVPRADQATRYGQVAPVPPVTRTQTATNAGLSDRQRKTALRIANVPEKDFERQVEGPNPPTPTQLAEQGRIRRDLTPDPAADRFKAACTALHQFATFCDTHDPIETAQTFGADDVEMARRCVSSLDSWLDRFVASLTAEG
jgi:hypothetical protein